MNDLNDLRKASLEFRRLSSNFLKTTDDDNFLHVKRLYTYLHEQPIIQKIIDEAILNSDYDYEQFIILDNFGRQKLNTPVNEIDHVKAMYKLLAELASAEENQYLRGIAMSFIPRTGSFNEIIQIFLEKTFKPLIDFIIDALSKEMIILEKQTAQFSQYIENNHGTANVGEVINSTNIIQQNDLQEIESLISTLKIEIEKSSLSEDEKGSVLDDLDVIKEQVESNPPKLFRLNKAIKGFKDFITHGMITATAFVVGAKDLIDKVEQAVEMLTR